MGRLTILSFVFLAATVGLRAAGPLAIDRAVISQVEDGLAPADDDAFRPGEHVYLRFEIAGYKTMEKDDRNYVGLRWEVRALDPNGVPLVPANGGKIETEVVEQDKNWTPKVRWFFLLPQTIPSGDCRLAIEVEDLIGKTKVYKDVLFPLRGPTVEPSPTLVIRNFRFLRSETDRTALQTAAYRPGDALWVRFNIVGYRIEAKNLFDASYTVAIRNSKDEQLYEAPGAAMEKEEHFYPRRWIEGIFSIDIPKDILLGTYTLVVKAHDGLGGQDFEVSQPFRVERSVSQ